MATEHLDLVISVVGNFEGELDDLIIKLGEVEAAAEATDNITIDVDVRGERKLDALIGRLGAVAGMGVAADAGADVGVGGAGGGAAGGGAAGAAASAAKAADDLEDQIDLTNIRMSDMHNLLAALVPLLITFIGAVPALVGGLIVLATAAVAAAAALAAIAGFGVLGAAMVRGEGDLAAGFSEIIDEVQDDFLEAFEPLAQRLAPLFEDGLDGLDRLFQAIAARGDVLVAFGETARGFGEFMMDFLPALLADMGRMARSFGPFFGELMNVFDFSVLGAVTVWFAQMADDLILFTELLLGFLPLIGDLSIGFLRVVNAIGLAIQGFAQLLNVIPLNAEAIGVLIAALTTALTVVFLGSKIWALYTANVTAATGATIAFLSVTGGILLVAALVGTLAGNFDLLGDNIDSATRSLKKFNRLGDDLGRNPYADPRLRPGDVTGPSGMNQVNVNIEGNADEEMVREQAGNALYRMERRRRAR